MDNSAFVTKFKNGFSKFAVAAKSGFSKYEQFVRKFIYTDYYLLLVAFFLFLGWVTRCAPLGLTMLILLSFAALIASEDILPFTINIFGAALIIYTSDISQLLYMWPVILLLIPGFVVFIARNVRRKFTLGKMFYPQIAVSVALLLGGAGIVAGADYLRALPTALVLGVGVLALYVFYNHFLKRDGKHDIPTYFSKVMMYLGIVIALELIVTILRSGVPVSQWHKEYWDLGWGNRNNVATYLMLTAGLTFYLSTKSRHSWLYLAAGFFQNFCIILSFSRGGILFGGISGIIALVLSIVRAQNRKHALITTGIVLAVILVLYLAFMGKINTMIGSLLSRGMDTSGRTELYVEAWQCFKAHPFLGVGMGYLGNNFDLSVANMYWFHSTLFQVIASMGIVGIAAYVYFYVIRAYLLFKNIKHTFNLFILAIWIGFEGYCMIDAGTFVPYPNMMLIIIMTLLLEVNLNNKLTEKILASEYSRGV